MLQTLYMTSANAMSLRENKSQNSFHTVVVDGAKVINDLFAKLAAHRLTAAYTTPTR